VSAVLEEVATTADGVAYQQRQVASEARAMQRLRRRGLSWAQVLDAQRPPGVFALLRASGRGVTHVASLLSRAVALGLTEEGWSQRWIAARLGVTHQRVSAILRRPKEGRP
jgi:predicted transcriptional regulator